MSWTAPRTWVAGEVVTAAIGNTHWRDNLRYLKGLDGTVTLDDGLDLGANELTINSLETVGVDGIVNKEQVEDHTHQDAANCGTLDHGLALTGLTDDDHTQYQLKSLLTTAGDVVYATGASTWVRLAIGTPGQFLRTNVGGTAPEWFAGVATHEFFVPVTNVMTSGAVFARGDFATIQLNAGAEYVQFSFKCPHDFSTLTHCKVLMIIDTSGTIDWTVTTDFAAIGEVSTTNSDTATADGLSVTDNEIEEVDISAAFTGLAADDYIGCKFVIDTLTTVNSVYIIGIVFKYS